MDEGTALPEEAVVELRDMGFADIVVGIPSFHNVETISRVVEIVGRGLALHFPRLRGAVVNSDGGSEDGTREAALAAPLPPRTGRLVTTYRGLPGKGSALRAIFEAARALGARACVVVDSDLRSITPEWVRKLAGPIVNGHFDYVAPLYIRHKHDGTITNNIAYPMTRALYGLDVRQPIGGDFGVSGSLVRRYLELDVWESEVARFGIDIWMTTTAIAGGFGVAQAPLGFKVHDAKDPAQSLGPMFAQVVGTLFDLMGIYEDRWREIAKVRPAPVLEDLANSGGSSEEPESVAVDVEAMIQRFGEGFRSHGRAWGEILGRESHRALEGLVGLPSQRYHFPASLWVEVAFDFAIAYHRGLQPHAGIMEAMVPLYLGRTAGLIKEMEGMTSREAEAVVRSQADAFFEGRDRLLRRWAAV